MRLFRCVLPQLNGMFAWDSQSSDVLQRTGAVLPLYSPLTLSPLPGLSPFAPLAACGAPPLAANGTKIM